MTSPQAAFGYETLSVDKRMIIKISCHNTPHMYSGTKHITYLHETHTKIT